MRGLLLPCVPRGDDGDLEQSGSVSGLSDGLEVRVEDVTSMFASD